MRTILIACFVASAFGQSNLQGLKEVNHLRSLAQPHLPRDDNVLHQTQEFLLKFAELKALADAAPDPVDERQARPSAPRFTPSHSPAPVRAPAPLPPPPAPAPHRFAPSQPSSDTFDVNMKIASLLSQHHAPVAPPRQPQFAPQQVPTFAVQDNFASQQNFGRPSAAPVRQRPVDLSIPTTNEHGLLINPERFPGPLADTVPAGVGGRVQHVQFTPEVAAAHKNLADAHAQILSLQSNLRV
ncbi:translation initiation factor IF-2-like [Penaeus monodon]|uniref:translation initiation factor IF-2-like n=1 Tax=Penaeus monodon TaxID=6687 RepID=UPI0018A73C3A|nr:translation initiation factor IF-2-like [Penaeus monodon]